MSLKVPALGMDWLNLALINDSVPFPSIVTMLVKRLLVPNALSEYRSDVKSKHTPRSERSADRTASPTRAAGRLLSYAEDNSGSDTDVAADNITILLR